MPTVLSCQYSAYGRSASSACHTLSIEACVGSAPVVWITVSFRCPLAIRISCSFRVLYTARSAAVRFPDAAYMAGVPAVSKPLS